MNRISLIFTISIAALSGCAAIQPPTGYVKDSRQHTYDYKAVSPRGNVIAVSSHANDDKNADLKFWTEAVEYQKIDLDGMKLAAKESIHSRSGLEGVLFNFETGEGRGKSTYLVALYVTNWKVYTIEATGPAAAIAKDMDSLKTSMQSLR